MQQTERVEQLIEKAKSYEHRMAALASKKDRTQVDVLKFVDLKRRHAQVLEWITHPELDQLIQPQERAQARETVEPIVIIPEGIDSGEAHPAE